MNDELKKALSEARKAIKGAKVQPLMGDSDPDLVYLETLRLMQTEACALASEAHQLCADLTDILIQLEPP